MVGIALTHVSICSDLIRRSGGGSNPPHLSAQRRLMMRYALLIYTGEAATAQMSPQDLHTLMAGHAALVSELGPKLFGGGQLLPTASATTVRVRGGQPLITDGPFAETKEQLGGFYLITCQDLDEAIAWAQKIPDVGVGSIEIRPLREVGGSGGVGQERYGADSSGC